VSLGNSGKVAPLFHHELFHIYHDQFLPEQDSEPLYVSLWHEGLAVHHELVADDEFTRCETTG
jgi:hypothetical protein